MRPPTKHAGGKNFKPKAAQSKNAKGGKPASLKNQIRAVERLLQKVSHAACRRLKES
jgi:hypothetical protein